MSTQTIKALWRRYWLWLFALAVAVPGLVLLAVQYRSLRKLDETLPYYRRATMQRCLAQVNRNLLKLYDDNANQALAVPREAFGVQKGRVVQFAQFGRALTAAQVAAAHFQRQSFKGALRYFIVITTMQNGSASDEILFYNPVSRQMELDPQAPELRAIKVASTPFMMYARSGAVVQTQPFGADRDANHVMILKAITDENDRVVSVAGLVVEHTWLRREVMPQLIEQALPIFFPTEKQNAVVTLRFMDQVVYSTQPGVDTEPEAFLRMGPLLGRYTLGMSMRGQTVNQWARRNLYLNLALTLTMALALAGALAVGLRAAAREMRLSRMKTDFVANVTHELRTPLTSILMLTELARTGRVRDPEKLREFADYIDGQSRRLLQLINNILDFSRMDGGLKQYQFAPTDVIEVVEQALAACAGRLAQSRHTVHFEPPEAPLPLLQLDAEAMTRAVINLLDNAIKYSGEAGEIDVRIECGEREIGITVRDHGVGIARAEQERIFEKFYRVSTGLVHDVKGSGLGLTIVRHIVAAHHARVTVESELGRGSAFTIHLPINSANQS